MAISVILISLDSSEKSVGTSTARVILFSMIPTTIPSTTPTVDLPVIHDDTPQILIDTPTISPIVPTIPPISPTIQYTSPFICTDSSDSDTSERPPSQDPYKVTAARWRSRPIPVGRPYRTQPNRVLKMLTVRKSVGSLPIHRLASRYPSDSSSLDHFTSDDSSRDSSSKTSSYSHSNTSSGSSSRHSSSGYAISDSPCDSSTDISPEPSCKRCRPPTSSVPVALPVHGALSLVRVDLLPPPKRIRDSDSVTDFEVSLEEGYVSYVDIDECFAYVDAIRSRGTDVRVVFETAAEEEVESSARGTVEVEVDPRVGLVIDEDVRESVREDFPDHVTADRAVEVTYETLGDLVQIFHDHTMEIPAHRIQVIESVQRD
ncbi:hypothetical protein Tco_1066569 [Tanacetum coccineum]|uniref:Uncharacterized protein n=1 Tax=Tanacetum coccineum TaxID=301880 RepID=A0ABQ5HC61_9ASTR